MAAKTKDPKIEEADIVMLGAFNPAIFHPEWFFRQGLADQSDSDKVNVVSRAASEIHLGNIHLTCVENRLVFQISNMAYAEAMQDLAVGVLAKLPHTPLEACGINCQAVFKADSEKQWHLIGDTLAPKDFLWNKLCEKPGMKSLAIQCPAPESIFPGEVNFYVEPLSNTDALHPAIVVRANTHFKVELHARNSEVEATQLVRDFLQTEWKESIGRARTLGRMIFEKLP